jgi:hypothetical protein
MKIKLLLFKTLLLIITGFILSSNAKSQSDGFRFSAGLSTIEIIGDDVNANPFVYETIDGASLYGGSFDQSQNGLRIEAIFPMDKIGRFELPFGAEYNFFMGRERQPISDDGSDIKFKHDIDIATITLGLNYAFYRFNPLNSKAKFYVGLDTRTAFIFNAHYESKIKYVVHDSIETIAFDTKESAVRFGGTINIGLNGMLFEPVSVDFKAGLGILNLVGKNDERGELLTPRKKTADYIETKESTIFTFNFAMIFQVRI